MRGDAEASDDGAEAGDTDSQVVILPMDLCLRILGALADAADLFAAGVVCRAW